MRSTVVLPIMMITTTSIRLALFGAGRTALAAFSTATTRRQCGACVAAVNSNKISFDTTFAAFATRPTTLGTRSLSQSLFRPNTHRSKSTVTYMSSMAGGGGEPQIQHIGKAEMQEILEDYEMGGREDSMYCVIDVRTDDEVMATGKLAPSVYTLPVQLIAQKNAFAMDPEDFEAEFGFAKPTPDETLVFTCAAGVRSTYACQFAAKAGYSNLVNYAGGANEWFNS